MQAKLNCISSNTFPIPLSSCSASSLTGLDSNQKSADSEVGASEGKAVSGSNMLKFHLRPASRVNQLEATTEPLFDVPAIQKQLEQGNCAQLDILHGISRFSALMAHCS